MNDVVVRSAPPCAQLLKIGAAIALGLTILPNRPAHADTWIGTPGSPAPFSVGTNWTLGVVPTTPDSAQINNGGTATITDDSESYSVSRIEIGTSSTGNQITQTAGVIGATGPLRVGVGTGAGGSYVASGTAQILVGGTGNADNTSIGRNGGTGIMNLSGGTLLNVSSGETFIGQGTGGQGTLVMGDTAEFIANSWIAIGRQGGSGVATLNGSAKLHTAVDGFVIGAGVGAAPGATTGQLTLNGSSEAFYEGTNSQLMIGETGTGTVTVNDSAKLYSTQKGIWVGTGTGGNGTLIMNGGSATAADESYIGNDGATGVVNLHGSSVFTSGVHKFVISRFGATGTVTLDGNSTLNVGTGSVGAGIIANITVGENGPGVLTVSDSASVVSGQNATTLYVGSSNFSDSGRAPGVGTLTINGGTLTTNNSEIELAHVAGSQGTLNLNGGTVTAIAIRKGAGTATVNFNGGTVKAGAASSNYFVGFNSINLVVQSGGLKLDTGGNNVTITQALNGVGGLSKLGLGTLTLGGVGAYQGNTFIDAGTLSISSAMLADQSNVVMTLGGVFNLNFSGEDTIGALVVNGVALAVGTWGSTISGATHQDDSLFSGTGVLNVTTTVVPEPSTTAVLLMGLAMVTFSLGRRNIRKSRPLI